VFEGVPSESVSISPRLKGYRLSLQNPSLDRLNGFSVVGRAEGHLDNFVILLEPGEFRRDHIDRGPDAQPYNKPLRSFNLETAVGRGRDAQKLERE
jgi:hypothetical protein